MEKVGENSLDFLVLPALCHLLVGKADGKLEIADVLGSKRKVRLETWDQRLKKEVRYACYSIFSDRGSLRVRLADNYAEPGPWRGDNDLRSSAYAWAQQALNERYFNSVYAGLRTPEEGSISGTSGGAPQQPPYTSVSFRVWRVDCVDETGMEALGQEAGHDEIWMGATTVQAQGIIEKVSAFKVKDFASDGDYHFYSGSRVIKQFPIGAGWPFPQANIVFLHLAEVDQGGFGDFLNDFYKQIQPYVVGVLIGAGAAIGAQYGATLGSIGGPIGIVVGAVLGAIIGFIIGWIIEALRDDIFESQSSAIQIPSNTDNFNGSDRSPVYTLTYSGHNGEYKVYYDWLLLK